MLTCSSTSIGVSLTVKLRPLMTASPVTHGTQP
jgi:hypothetical protein